MQDFLKSLYFGDRYCEKMEIHREKVIIQINCISRIEPENNQWNYYTKDDISHGQLIFEDISFFEMNPNMLINDEFYGIDLIEENSDGYTFNFQGAHVSDNGDYIEINAIIKCKSFYILNPVLGVKITKSTSSS